MKLQFDIYTKYFRDYKRGFWEALSTIIYNRKELKRVNIWIIFRE